MSVICIFTFQDGKSESKIKKRTRKNKRHWVSIKGALVMTSYKGMPVTSGGFQQNEVLHAILLL